MTRLQRNGLLLILASAVGYSFFPIFTKVMFDNGIGSPLDILLWRFVVATPLAWLYITVVQGRRQLASSSDFPRWRTLAAGFLFGSAAMLAFYGLQRVPVSLYTVLIYTYPAIVAVGGLLFGERLSRSVWVALGLTLLGVILTVPNIFNGFSGVDPLGVVLVLANACCYGSYILLSGRLLRGVGNLTQASVWSITGSLLFALCMMALRIISGENIVVPQNIGIWGGLAGLVLVSTILPIITFYAGLSRLGAARAAIVSMIEPVLTLIWAVFLRGETLTLVQIAGGLLILASVALLQLRHTPSYELPPVTKVSELERDFSNQIIT